MSKSSWFASLLGLTLVAGGAAACSGGANDGVADAGVADGSGNGANCPAVANFGDLGVIDGVINGAAIDNYLVISHTLDAVAPIDVFSIDLQGGVPPFTTGIRTGIFEITGAQTGYDTCGACVLIYADIDYTAELPGMRYIAQSGTLRVTSVEGNFSGSYTPSGETTSFVGYGRNPTTEMFERQDECVVTGGGASWDKAIPPGP